MDADKQWELMFLDANEVLRDAKMQLSGLMRWVVGLNAGIVLLAVSDQTTFSDLLFIAPVLVTICGLALGFALMAELETHRSTLADIRRGIGGHMLELHGEFVEEYHDGKRSVRGWFRFIRTWLETFVMAASGAAAMAITVLGRG